MSLGEWAFAMVCIAALAGMFWCIHEFLSEGE